MPWSAIHCSVSGPGPVAAQPDLQEPVAAGRAAFDEPAHRLAVAVEAAELDVAGVGVRVEVQDRHPAVTHVPRDPLHVRERDAVVAAQHHRHRAARAHRRDGLLQRGERALDVAGEHLDVAGVEHPQVAQRVDAEGQVRPGAVVPEVVGGADRPGPEARAGAVRRAAVERRADDDDVGAGEAVGSARSQRSTPRKVMSGPYMDP
jgi:hypothetical protein